MAADDPCSILCFSSAGFHRLWCAWPALRAGSSLESLREEAEGEQTRTSTMKTVLTRKEDVDRRWYHIDASDAVLGKLAVKVARLLMGKDKTIWTPGVDVGDFVVVTQADRVKVTGRKETGKVYRRYTGYAGGLREASLGELREKKPEKVIELAVRRMLPKTRLGRAMLRRLKIYAGAEHEHAAQKPQTIQLASTQK